MKTIKRIFALTLMAIAPLALYSYPIVFIHGWNSDKSTWGRMITLMTTQDTDGNVPYTTRDMVFAVDYSKITGLIGETSISEVAGKVWDQIRGFSAGMDAPKIDFVVHSMGGLVLRQMVANGQLPESKIGRVVTLGTPHYGQRHNVPTWLLGGSLQTREMFFGSEFLWNLANSTKKISSNKILCIGGTEDRVVDEWSAALDDKDCRGTRYVNRCHSTASEIPFVTDEDAIYYCKLSWSDPVYKLVEEFLWHNRLFGGSINGKKDEGAILFQIVDGKGKPVSYETPIVTAVKNASGANMSFQTVSPTTYDDATQGSRTLGIGAVYVKANVLPSTDGLPTGAYSFDIAQSKDEIFSAFTTDSIVVKRGRTTVIPIPAENVRPLDFVFLVDTTGSMGDDIASVRRDANNLIRDKLLNGARDCRVAVVDYRDFPDRTGDSDDYPYDVKCQFTSDASTAIGAINALTLGDGGDTPETVYSGIAACIWNGGNLIGEWRPNAVKTIMIMCDAKPLDPEPYTGYTAAKVAQWVKTMKMDEEDEESGIEWRRYASKKVAALRKLAAEAGESGVIGTGVSIYPVLTSSSSSLRAAFSDIAEESGGKIVSAAAYASVADAVEEVIEQSVAANGFETEIVTVRETAGNVSVRVFGGSTADAASIGYQIVSGSAVNGKDYTAAEGIQRLTWAEGERSYKTITIPVSEDASTSNDKFFSIILCDPSGMGLGSISVCRINLLDRDSDGEFRVGDVYVQGLSRNSEMGSVSGSGFCAAGAAVTLTATPKSGYVFTSWENGSMASRRSISAADASTNAVDGVASYVASFVPLADLPMPTIESSGVVTGIVGQAVSWGLDYYSMSEATVTCAGLPSGLTFANGVISGTPAKSGTSTLTFTARNAKGETSASMTFVFVRDPSAPYLAEEGNEGEFNAKGGALTYDGYLLDASGNLAGTILVQTAKANAGSGVSKITATVQPMNGKKLTFKGETVDGRSVSVKAGNQTAVLTLGVDGMTGKFGDYTIDGSRNVFASKNNDEKSAANAVLGRWKAINAVWDGGSMSVAIAAKGKVKVTGTLSDGTKVSAKGQLVIGTEWLCVPVVWAKQKAHLAFMLWIDKDGDDIMVEGLDNASAGQPAALKDGAAFRIDTAALCSILGDSTYGAYLPNGIAVEQKGTKWLVANGAKAGKVQLGKDGNVDATKAGANASGLKLTYKVKDGTFKGSFKAYANVRGKPMATTVNVTGVVIGDKGYGVATITKKGSVTVNIE